MELFSLPLPKIEKRQVFSVVITFQGVSSRTTDKKCIQAVSAFGFIMVKKGEMTAVEHFQHFSFGGIYRHISSVRAFDRQGV
ncbi:hypothetical protein D9M69_625150 [compost metagenome]